MPREADWTCSASRASTSRSSLTLKEALSEPSSPTTSSKRSGAAPLPPPPPRTPLARFSSLPSLQNRVTSQIDSERNFHIFYQLTKGASAAQRDAYGLQGPEAYAYTSRSNCLDVPGIDDVADWAETLTAMGVIGITPDEQDNMFRSLATVLWLGNVQFKEGDDGNAFIADESVPAFVAYLLEVDAAMVTKVLTSRVVETQRGGRRGAFFRSFEGEKWES